MKKRLAVLALTAALGVGATSPVAAAETFRVAQEETEDDGDNSGWIGLLGLAGLAGLLGLRRRDDRGDTTRR